LALLSVKLGDNNRAKQLATELVGRGPTLDPSIREQAQRLLKHLD
jgi:hypothetical protein